MAQGWTYDKARKKYQVRVTIDGERKYIGRYDTEEEANAAYEANRPSSLSEVRLQYAEVDFKPFDIKGMIRNWRKQIADKRALDKAIREKLEEL